MAMQPRSALIWQQGTDPAAAQLTFPPAPAGLGGPRQENRSHTAYTGRRRMKVVSVQTGNERHATKTGAAAGGKLTFENSYRPALKPITRPKTSIVRRALLSIVTKFRHSR